MVNCERFLKTFAGCYIYSCLKLFLTFAANIKLAKRINKHKLYCLMLQSAINTIDYYNKVNQ